MSRSSASSSPENFQDISSPTVAHRFLTTRLRDLREATEPKLTQAQVGKILHWSHGKVGQIETRHVSVRREDVAVMLPLYGVTGAELEHYLSLCDSSRKKGWWDGAPGVPQWFKFYVGLEAGAKRLSTFELSLVPGLLQTPAYARAVLANGIRSETELEYQHGQRMRRQDVLKRSPRPLELHAVIDEAVLHRQVGGPAVMREQLAHLVSLTRSTTVSLRVIPFNAGEHLGQLGSFSWLRFPHDADYGVTEEEARKREEEDLGVVYVENQTGGVYLDDREQIGTFKNIFEKFTGPETPPGEQAAGSPGGLALSPEDSASLIEQIQQGV